MSQGSDKKIFFHVGLGKTASTYLQKRVFPYFEDIEYIQRASRFARSVEIIKEGNPGTYFISREFDQQFEYEIKKFAAHYPDTTIIIVFRPHAGWIASQYRRFFKNGVVIPFTQFFDLKNDNGLFKKSDLTFYHYLELIEENFTKKPLVLFYEDLRKDPMPFFDRIANTIGVKYDKNKINLESKHSSYSEKQLKAIRYVSKFMSLRKDNMKRPIFYPIRRLYTNLFRYSTLFIGKQIPDSWYSSEPLIAPEELKEVTDYFKEDWNAVVEYAKKNNAF